MSRRSLSSRQLCAALLALFVVAGCTPVREPAPAAQALPPPQCSGEELKGSNPNTAYYPTSIILTGLAADIIAVIGYLESQDPATAPVAITLPQGLDATGQPNPDIQQQGWFTATLGTNREEILANLGNLFNAPPQDLGQPAVLTFAKAAISSRVDDQQIRAENLPFLALAQVTAASDQLYFQGELQLPVYPQLNNSVTVPKSLSINPNGVGAHGCGPLSTFPGGASLFWSQWALQPYPGINAFPASPDLGCQSAGSATTPVRVVVFDTSPAEVPPGAPLGSTTATWSIDLGAPCGPPALALEVSSFVTPAAPISGWSQHGLYSAGLVYAAWRHAKLHLARVMDNDGRGDLLTLLQAMIAWRETMAALKEPAVFNLSLGVNSADAILSQHEQDILLGVLNNMNAPERASLAYKGLELDDLNAGPLTRYALDPGAVELVAPLQNATAVALETVVRLVNGSGIAIVAAAGNDGGPAQYPAVYRSVLGVAALGGPGTAGLAPYSNLGDIAAPGGSGDPSLCSDALCPEGVLSVYATDAAVSNYGLAFWSGTSFAAPLVSGLVAQRYAGYALNHGGAAAAESEIATFVAELGATCVDTVPGAAGAADICVASLDTAPSLPDTP